MYALKKSYDENNKLQMKLVYNIDDKGEPEPRLIEFDAKEDDDPPLHSFYVTAGEFGANVDSYVQISCKQIKVFDRLLQEKWTYAGLNIRQVHDIHQAYLYTISDRIDTCYYVTQEETDDNIPKKTKVPGYSQSGLYVFDIAKLLKGSISKYKISTAIGGVCSSLDNSKFSDRFSYIENFNHISIIPFPHVNLINCIGMG